MNLKAVDRSDNIFEYYFFSPQKNIKIRYGIARPIPCSIKSSGQCSGKAPANGIFLLLHGRSEFIEKYAGIARKLLAKGFWVISPDWRGQGLSSRELENRHKGHILCFESYVNDLEALVSRVIEPLGLPVYVLAHSMGGHIALRFMSRHPLKIERAVLASPMVEIAMPSWLKSVSKHLSKRLSKRTQFAGKYAFGSKDYSGHQAKFKGNNLSHDPEQFQVLHHEIKNNPDLALGGVTWGWLNAAFESIEFLKQADVIAKITPPILLLSAREDSVVSPLAQEKLSKKLPQCRFFSIKGAFHELLFEDADIREQLWDAIDRFILE